MKKAIFAMLLSCAALSVEAADQGEYVTDKIVNAFICDYNASIENDLTEIEKGNIKTKYFAYANDCYLQMLSYSDTLEITLYFDHVSEEEIYSTFTDILTALDVTEEEISDTVEAFTVDNTGNYMVSDFYTTDSVTCSYYPTKELSAGITIGRIEIETTNYKDI